ncbi:MAG: putative signaling protein [Paracidovorax wautersii]|uniref:Putative signaling protein n=1 Tax=Paracidovorax wautersii TaxID=1177982 RepID=A0A7V8JNL9_9BURK|nr:MAG: putative signaling protein [Paracidovorax wautersii]
MLLRGVQRLRAAPVMAAVALVALGIAVAIAYANHMVWASQSMRFNSTFESGQLSVELFRFEAALGDRFVAGSRTSQAELELRYQILLNRLQVIENGATFTALGYVPQGRAEYGAIKHTILGIEPRLAQLGDAAAAREVLDELLPLNGRILRLASSTQNVLASQVAQRQSNLGRVMIGISAIVVVLALFGLALVAFILRLKRRSDHDARHDALTGVLNRLGFNEALACWPADVPCAIVLLDVDNFKEINDRYGHEAGDDFLTQFAARLVEPAHTARVVARLGGDEFAVVFSGPQASPRAQAFCQAVAQALAPPFDVGTVHLTASASLGIASRPPGGRQDMATLMKSADIALYAAKEDGRACYRLFDPAMRDRMLRRQELRQGLFEALAHAQFHLHLQPIVDLADGKTVGAEALLRWTHPRLGEIAPSEFIPVAESSAQIIAIGRWVIEHALDAAARRRDGAFISINLSARQFGDAGLVDFVAQALARFALPPRRVVFEITESVLVHNAAAHIIASLRRLGVQIALDDFGTGFASLSYLRRFELDKLKIDKSFIHAAREDARNAVIVRFICQLARELGLEVIAEGVETPEQLHFVRSVGCHFVQGFLFEAPSSEQGPPPAIT